jgi:uncharacterized protein (TIGR02145 family)
VILGGEVTNDGGSVLTERGIYYGTTQTPSPVNTKVAMGGGIGRFSSKITGLSANTTYYARAYAINGQGTAYGNEVSFTTSVNPTGTFTDSRDGNTYKWVKIGNQVWMAENLAWLPAVSPQSESSQTEKYYYVYDYSGTDVSAAKATVNYTTYGVLYNWPSAMNGAASSSANPSGVQGACPSGWHLPGDAEWKQLETAMGMTQAQADATDWRGTDQGTQMKSTSGWINNGNGTNSSGFSGLPGGLKGWFGCTFCNIGESGLWWSATTTESSSVGTWTRQLQTDLPLVNRAGSMTLVGLSIRCVRDF